MIELYSEIEKLSIGDVYDYVMENNKSYALPYHNNTHIENVTLFVLKGCEYYSIKDSYKRLMLVATLFHDVDHTGSGKDDDKNILNSIKSFLDFNEDSRFVDEEEKFIIELIKATRYPYLQECSSLNEYQQIIRDADVIQGLYSNNYINSVVYAIARESNISLSEMISKQVDYLSNSKFCTEWATNLYQSKVEEVLMKVNKIKSFKSKI
jgi:hypothetical protein